jgi:glycerophosphoryl diester phosphodiesterase
VSLNHFTTIGKSLTLVFALSGLCACADYRSHCFEASLRFSFRAAFVPFRNVSCQNLIKTGRALLSISVEFQMPNSQRGRNHIFFQSGKTHPEVIAHRGGAGEWPAETIYAFEQAVKMGVDVLEMDIRYTSDNVLILMHNSNVKDTTGVDKEVKEMKWADIQQLDAAYWWRKAGKVFPPGARLGVPSLEEVLKEFRGRRMVIEIKPWDFSIKLVDQLGGLIQANRITDTVLVASGWYMPLHFFRRKFPDVATSASVGEMVAFRYFNFHPKVDAIQTMSKFLKYERINEGFIKRAHRANLMVHGWTVNEPEEMGRLLSLDVDGIITDYPTTLLELLGRREKRPPSKRKWRGFKSRHRSKGRSYFSLTYPS